MRSIAILALVVICGGRTTLATSRCSRIPEGYGATKTPADGRYHIRITENTNKYVPGKTYTIMLEGIDTGSRTSGQGRHGPPVRHKFTSFMLAVEKKTNESTRMTEDFSSSTHGVFTLGHGDTQTKLTCGNMVTHTTTSPKSEIQILWTAPQPGSGCVVFRATVVEHRDVWYMDDGPLSKEFCEDDQNLEDIYNAQIDPCCACTEAKYELTFEGLWSRNTHPKDFPTNSWLTRFSDIIGATHAIDYRFWQYGERASEGLRQVAERGATRMLESELKNESEHIRTIIKARGLAHPNVTGKTFAVFRVDPVNHLVSFVSMIDPSPDWFVGVSGLELCLPNCTWIENKVLELYPWDAGTDSGATYISPDQPTNPKDHIRRIKADYPNDPRSPFYDPEALKMKPLARLMLNRQRLYEKNCQNAPDGGNEEDTAVRACKTSKWGPWDRCDSDCGKGMQRRQRQYEDPDLAMQMGCNALVTQRRECNSPCENTDLDEENPVTEAACALSEWSDWSECTPKCGPGYQFKERRYQNKRAKKRCEGGHHHPMLRMNQTCMIRECVGEIPGVGEDDGRSKEMEVDCSVEEWTQYEPCNKTCGGGYKVRYKEPINPKCDRPPIEERVSEMKECNTHMCSIPSICWKDPVIGTCRNSTNKWFFNRNESRCEVFTWTCGKDMNKFDTFENCTETCTGYSMDLYNRKNSNRYMFEFNQRRDQRGHRHGGGGNAAYGGNIGANSGYGDYGRNRNVQQWERRR